MMPNRLNSQEPNEETVRHHKSENDETEAVELLEDESDRNKDEKQHQPVQHDAEDGVLLPPPVCFEWTDFKLGHRPVHPYPRTLSGRGYRSSDADHSPG